jgi:hypothetical protein
MDRRLNRILALGSLALGLGVTMIAPGCRSTRSEVPPGKPYSTTGTTPGSVGFNSDPRTASAANGGGTYGNSPIAGAAGQDPNALGGGSPTSPMGGMSGSSSAPVQYGTPAPTQGLYGAPTSNRYGTLPLSPTPGGGN